MRYSMNVPMWLNRFVDAQNHLSKAVELMKQSYFADENNPAFRAIYEQMNKVYETVCVQSAENFERIRK